MVMFDNVKTQIRCYKTACIYNSNHKSNCGYCIKEQIQFTNEGCMDYQNKFSNIGETHEM